MAAYGIIDTWRKTSGFIAVPPWCNGSTRVFGTLCLGSSPGGGAKGLCLGGYSDPLDMTGPSPPIRTGTLSDTARPNPSPTTEILPCGRPFLRDLLDSTVQGGNRLC